MEALKAPEQVVPFSQEAEQALLGAALLDPTAFHRCVPIVGRDDFFLLRHALIWEALERLSEQREQIDYLTVIEALRSHGKLDETGGPAYLTTLINATPTSTHAEVYAHLVGRAAVRRNLLAFADQCKALALNETLNLVTVIDDVASEFHAATRRVTTQHIRSIYDIADEYFTATEAKRERGEEMQGFSWGFPSLDSATAGQLGGTVTIVGGRPGMGKSAFLGNVIANTVNRRHPMTGEEARILLLTMEMRDVQVVERLLAGKMQLNSNLLRRGKLNDVQWKQFNDAHGEVGLWRLWIDDSPDQTLRTVYSKIRAMVEGFGVNVVAIDYIQLIQAVAEKGARKQRYQELGEFSAALKAAALEFGIPILVAAQVSRECEKRSDKRPELADLRESGNLENDADVVLFPFRPWVYDPKPEYKHYTEIDIAKNRNGATGLVHAHYTPIYTQFREWDLALDGDPPKV